MSVDTHAVPCCCPRHFGDTLGPCSHQRDKSQITTQTEDWFAPSDNLPGTNPPRRQIGLWEKKTGLFIAVRQLLKCRHCAKPGSIVVPHQDAGEAKRLLISHLGLLEAGYSVLKEKGLQDFVICCSIAAKFFAVQSSDSSQSY